MGVGRLKEERNWMDGWVGGGREEGKIKLYQYVYCVYTKSSKTKTHT